MCCAGEGGGARESVCLWMEVGNMVAGDEVQRNLGQTCNMHVRACAHVCAGTVSVCEMYMRMYVHT